MTTKVTVVIRTTIMILLLLLLLLLFPPVELWPNAGAMANSFLGFLDHTQRRITVGRTPLDEWSARRRDFYLTTHNTHNRQTSMSPLGFERTISAGERPQTYALDRAATGTANDDINDLFNNSFSLKHTALEALVAQRLMKCSVNTNNRLSNSMNE